MNVFDLYGSMTSSCRNLRRSLLFKLLTRNSRDPFVFYCKLLEAKCLPHRSRNLQQTGSLGQQNIMSVHRLAMPFDILIAMFSVNRNWVWGKVFRSLIQLCEMYTPEWRNNGRFHTRRRTNRLHGQIAWDGSRLVWKRYENTFGRTSRLNLSVHLAVWRADF